MIEHGIAYRDPCHINILPGEGHEYRDNLPCPVYAALH